MVVAKDDVGFALDQFAGEGQKAFVVPLGPTQVQGT